MPGLRLEERRGELCAGVLYRHAARLEPGKNLYGNRALQHHGLGVPVDGARLAAHRAPRSQEIFDVHLSGIDSEHHGRVLIVGDEDLRGGFTPGVDQCVDQPAWMRVPLRELGIDGGKQFDPLRDEAAHHRIDDSAGASLAQHAARVHGEMHLCLCGSA